MYNTLKPVLEKELAEIEAAGLYKRERVITSPQGADITVQGGKEVINFCANNYLGLSGHPKVVQAAKDHGVSMRIGVNAGSLEKELLERHGEPCPEAMVESALNHAKILEDNDFFEFKISCKASDVFLAVAAYQGLADACDYPLHVGITEAGGMISGSVKSSIGMGMLLWSGIGDTIRV